MFYAFNSSRNENDRNVRGVLMHKINSSSNLTAEMKRVQDLSGVIP